MRPNDSHLQPLEQHFSKRGPGTACIGIAYGEGCENSVSWALLQVTRVEPPGMGSGGRTLTGPPGTGWCSWILRAPAWK